MGNIIFLDQFIRRRTFEEGVGFSSKLSREGAEILLFLGVRYERYEEKSEVVKNPSNRKGKRSRRVF